MYSIICTAVDSVIEPLERITEAAPWVAVLRKALLDAEDAYIESSERGVGDATSYDSQRLLLIQIGADCYVAAL